MPDELYYLSRGKLTQKQGLYSKISKMQLKGDLRSKNRALYHTHLRTQTKLTMKLKRSSFKKKWHISIKKGGETSKKYMLTPPSIFSRKIDAFWLLFDPKNSFPRVNWNSKRNVNHLFHVVPLEITIFGSKSSQIASIFREKIDGGGKKCFFGVSPP